MSKRMLVLMCSIFLVVPLLFLGCSGDDGSTGATGAKGDKGDPGQDLTATAKPETCTICHPDAGDDHQSFYDALYQGGVIKVANLQYNFTGNNDVVTFELTKNGVDADCTKVTNLNIYFTPYDNTGRFQFTPQRGSLSIKGTTPDNVLAGTLVYNSTTGVCTSTKPSFDNVSLATKNGEIVLYGYDGLVGLLPPSRVRQVNYPYAALLQTGTVNYVSAATVTGCEKCHTIPYLKHGNILARVNDNAATDFITCKACHLDNGPGGHQFWQELVDDPEMAAREHNNQLTAADNTARAAKYAYKTRLMNDVHMSHAMEFEYPQSMVTCATCHAGKLNLILTDNNFTLETCRSCHPVTGSAQSEKPQPALKDILPAAIHGSMDLYDNSTACNGCHRDGGLASSARFINIHNGYDKIIYAGDNGVKFSSIFKVTIDNASFDNNNVLRFGFHATGDLAGFATTNITPTVLVGLYGYDTKDYIVGPHESYPSTYPDNALKGRRYLEFNAATPTASNNSAYITVTKTGSAWNATANLSAWASLIADGSVKRVEIGVMPALKNPNNDNALVALDAPSRTFDLKANAFKDTFYPAIVNVKPPAKGPSGGCNNCHDALAVNFHSPDRGGNIVICRLCHITKAGGSHLEMQSRSIDSYAHAIHTFQPFDIQNVNFDNAVASMYYDLKVESQYPTFDRRNCVSCHNAGMFNVPAQDKSLAGILSASRDTNTTLERDIVGVPSYVTGPASRACGACHRAVMIKEDQAAELASFNQHTKDGGYLLEPGTIATLETAINAILPKFNGNESVDITP